MKLYLHPKQIAKEKITGNEIYQHLKDTGMLKDCATLEDLQEYESGKKSIPIEWEGKYIYAWRSVQDKYGDGYLSVPSLHCNVGKPCVFWYNLDGSWDDSEPGLLREQVSPQISGTSILDLDTMSLEKAIEICKANGLTVTKTY